MGGQHIDYQALGRMGGGNMSPEWLLLLALFGRNGFGFDGQGRPCDSHGDPCTRSQLEALIVKSDLSARDQADVRQLIAERWGDLKAHTSDRVSDVKASLTERMYEKALADSLEHRHTDEKFCEIRSDIKDTRHDLVTLITTEGRLGRDVTINAERNILGALAADREARLLQRVTQLEIENNRHHDDHRSRESEIRVTQTVNQNQTAINQQQQTQAMIDLLRSFGCRLDRFETQINIGNQLAAQSARATQDIVNLGTMTGSGGLSANQANTAVRA